MRFAHFPQNTLNYLRGFAAQAPAREGEDFEKQKSISGQPACGITQKGSQKRKSYLQGVISHKPYLAGVCHGPNIIGGTTKRANQYA
jgi:hypothetical protein